MKSSNFAELRQCERFCERHGPMKLQDFRSSSLKDGIMMLPLRSEAKCEIDARTAISNDQFQTISR